MKILFFWLEGTEDAATDRCNVGKLVDWWIVKIALKIMFNWLEGTAAMAPARIKVGKLLDW